MELYHLIGFRGKKLVAKGKEPVFISSSVDLTWYVKPRDDIPVKRVTGEPLVVGLTSREMVAWLTERGYHGRTA